jgi:hypothetical protein
LIAFPYFERISIDNYGLYPGKDGASGLDLTLGQGPWLVLGVNGLGKSTLLLILRYMLAGPVRARSAGFAGDREDLQAADGRLFSVRVAGGANEATAKLVVSIGSATVTIERLLSNLSLKTVNVASVDCSYSVNGEREYRALICSLMGVSKFDDVVRIFDQLVFCLETKQPLIWDLAAQFELFRAILTPNLSSDLRRLEGEIVSSDSAARNLNAVLHKITQKRQSETTKIASAGDTRARIASEQGELDALTKLESEITERLDSAQSKQSDANLHLKRSEQQVDTNAQAYEKIKFEVLRQAFAGVTPTEQYLFLKLLSEKFCIACDQSAPQAAKEMQERIEKKLCVVCGNPRKYDGSVADIGDSLKLKAEIAFQTLERSRLDHSVSETQYKDSIDEVVGLLAELSTIRQNVDTKRHIIRALIKKLPADESLEFHREEDRVKSMRGQVLSFRAERELAERSISELLVQLSQAVEQVREKLETAFHQRAAPFFAEQVRLVYAPRNTKIGLYGQSFAFPAFEIEMTSGATLGQFIRRTSGQVSLSQREYLDVIFRMVLIDVIGNGAGTLVVDGPEGSLDAVFAGRGGELFATFSQQPMTSVVLACNIVEGDFIPKALKNYKLEDRRSRVVNLIEEATPTQALVQLRTEYTQKVDEILARDL